LLGSGRAHTDAVKLCGSTYTMRASPFSPSPCCRRLVAEPDSLNLNPRRHVRRTRIASLDGPCSKLCRAGEEVRWGAAWARYTTRSVRLYRAADVLRNPRIYAVVHKKGRRGGHLPQGSVGGQLVIRTRLGAWDLRTKGADVARLDCGVAFGCSQQEATDSNVHHTSRIGIDCSQVRT